MIQHRKLKPIHIHLEAMNSSPQLKNVRSSEKHPDIYIYTHIQIYETIEAPTHRWHGHETLSCLQFGMTCRQASAAAEGARVEGHGFGAVPLPTATP